MRCLADICAARRREQRFLRILFVKENLAWPRTSGHDVHTYHMMRALAQRGHVVALATTLDPSPEAIRGLTLEFQRTLDSFPMPAAPPIPTLSRLQQRFRSYWGIDPLRIAAVRLAADRARADAVVIVGLGVLPYFGALEGTIRVWYAADEWAWHHLSQFQWLTPSTWGNLRQALVKGSYERAFRRLVDRIWVVSDTDRRVMRLVSGVRNVDVLANGVDADYYQAGIGPTRPKSCVFWGRLDFGPNVQALQWFCRYVWPQLRRQAADASFSIYGFNPTPEIQALAQCDGVRLSPNLPDLRAEVTQHEVVVFPFISGGGIKNKLLEAACMGMAIVCTPRTTSGLREAAEAPFRLVQSRDDWVRQVMTLWRDSAARTKLGRDARQWVIKNHSWQTTAEFAEKGLEESRQQRPRTGA